MYNIFGALVYPKSKLTNNIKTTITSNRRTLFCSFIQKNNDIILLRNLSLQLVYEKISSACKKKPDLFRLVKTIKIEFGNKTTIDAAKQLKSIWPKKKIKPAHSFALNTLFAFKLLMHTVVLRYWHFVNSTSIIVWADKDLCWTFTSSQRPPNNRALV